VVDAATATKRATRLIRIARRDAAACWRGNPDLVITETGSIAFADAAEDDRVRWLNAFRSLLDGLDDSLQVVIHTRPGPDEDGARRNGHPAHRLDDMRGADLWFAQEMTRSSTSHRVIPSIVTSARTSARLHAVLSEMGIDFTTSGPMDPAFGKELPTRFLHVRGFSRTWCIDRLPGADAKRHAP